MEDTTHTYVFQLGKDIFNMNADLYKRLFKAIFSEDIVALKKIADLIISSERKKIMGF